MTKDYPLDLLVLIKLHISTIYNISVSIHNVIGALNHNRHDKGRLVLQSEAHLPFYRNAVLLHIKLLVMSRQQRRRRINSSED